MVQLCLSPTEDVTSPLERSEEGTERQEDPMMAANPNVELNTLQLNLEVTTVYNGYETYIEDGLICLKHKVRNLEKKKLKLEDYRKRLTRSEELNKDQLAAVEKYQEVLHNLELAQELQKTLDDLTQSLLKAQKKAVKREQVEKVEVERRRLGTVLQIQNLLHSLQHEHIRRDLLVGHNQAPHISAQQLCSLGQLATLLGVKRNNQLNLGEQMEQAAVVFSDLLEGTDKPVAGSTFKLLKEELTRLLNCKYFSCLLPNKTPEISVCVTANCSSKSRLYLTDMESLSTQNWRDDFEAIRKREPLDNWDMECPVHKPWRGAATYIYKVPTKKRSDCKQKKEKKAKGEQNAKLAVHMEKPLVVFNSRSTLPKDPILRKQQMEDFMTKIHGSFSFMQDSVLDSESLSNNGHPGLKRQSSGLPSPLVVQADLRSPADVLHKAIHSTPLPTRLMEHKARLTTGDQSLESSNLELSAKDTPHEPLQLADKKVFPSPPLYHRESIISVCLDERSHHRPTTLHKHCPCNGVGYCTPTSPQGQTFSTPPNRRTLPSAQFQDIHSVFKVNTSSPHNGELNYKPESEVFSECSYSTASTQTPPEFAPSEDEPQPMYQSDYIVGNDVQMFLSPGRSGGSVCRPGQSYYIRGSVRGMARGGKGLAQICFSSWHTAGGSYIPQAHVRDSGPVPYAVRDPGYQHKNEGGRPNSSAAWSDCSQLSSPDREGSFTIVDSGLGDSLSVSTVEVSLTPHSQHHPAMLPMQLYPLSQPLQVAFTASRTDNFAPCNLDQPIVFDQLHSNLGEMYDTRVGRFTCPVNGTYVFIFHILKLAITVPLYINLMRNEDVMVSAYANDGAPDHETASNHAILPLFQGDQVWLRLHRGAIYGSTWKYSTFSGFLLYQE
ncbi:caprin-2 [Pleuronectes platessa]|uniref:caprin-2 n=1 Tax=Pleuronectes platessa TaxID=8262 RepID=UPI00232A6EB7|nr:caprin-2 [Pleuronectes platessa]